MMRIAVPSHPLASGSFQIKPSSSLREFSAWTVQDHQQSFELLQKISQIWKKRNNNYAPLIPTQEKLHFLILSKEHRTSLSDLTKQEYLEVMLLSQKITQFFKKRGYSTSYLFHKTGQEAGQSVPHWHEHLLFPLTKAQDLVGKLTLLKNMFFGSTPLPSEELKRRVHSLQCELTH